VHVNNCNGHQAVYTCLSRSSTAAGTIIVQAFSDSLITGGCTGYLRQEFRELDLLDEITALKYENKIPNNVDISGHYRNDLIHKYRQWKGVGHVPKHTHPAIAWSITRPFPLEPITDTAKWELVTKDYKADSQKISKSIDMSVYVPAKQSKKENSNKKRKAQDDLFEHTNKKIKSDTIKNDKKRKNSDMLSDLPINKKSKLSSSGNNTSPVGLIWDGQNYSCAYDSLFTILYNIWNSDIVKWTVFFNKTNVSLSTLHNGFELFNDKTISIENARDNVRHYLHGQDSRLFPNGKVGMNITDLASFLCKTSKPICESSYECTDCDVSIETTNRFTYYIDLQRSELNINNADSIASILGRLFHLPTSRKCASCNNTLYKNTFFSDVPELLILHVPYADIKINTSFKFYDKRYHLKGIVYYGDNHYTSCVISENNSVWYHDGMQTGSSTILQGDKSYFKSNKWNKYNDNNAVLFVYIDI